MCVIGVFFAASNRFCLPMLEFFHLGIPHGTSSRDEINPMRPLIAFIGGGNMATSLIGGLLASAKPDQILVADPDSGRCSELRKQFGIQTTHDNAEAINGDVVILAVKPQLMQSVCRQLSGLAYSSEPLFISIAAGVRSTDIDRWLGGNKAIVRCMPNTPALLQTGATALVANKSVSESQKALAENILQSVGMTLWVDNEDELDAVTALSGSGPAYFFLLMESMQKAGEDMGLDAVTAQKLTLQTALGAARMANESNIDLASLRERVTSKGGTTEQAITSFETAGFRQTVKQALTAACKQSKTLADELGKDDT
jgi:pyrroline-5-carboxylate reductase